MQSSWRSGTQDICTSALYGNQCITDVIGRQAALLRPKIFKVIIRKGQVVRRLNQAPCRKGTVHAGETQFCSFLSLTLDVGQWPGLRPGRFQPELGTRYLLWAEESDWMLWKRRKSLALVQSNMCSLVPVPRTNAHVIIL
jgi:hypothetical protein